MDGSEGSSRGLHKLAVEVLKQYGIEPENVSIVQHGAVKTLWKVKTADNLFCLKRLKRPYGKVLFSVNAQIHIKSSGGNVPEVFPDKHGQHIVQYKNRLFVLYEWLHGKDVDFYSLTDLIPAIQGIARFHGASKGYIPVDGSMASSRFGKWIEEYNSIKKKLASWKKVAQSRTDIPYFCAYLKCIDPMLEISSLALKLIHKSSYKGLVSKNPGSIVLCPGNFGKGNAVLTNDGVFIIDLDDSTFNFPMQDLRKTIGSYVERKGQWGMNAIMDFVEGYSRVNPLTHSEKELLYIDMLFPHRFFGLVKHLFQGKKPVRSSEIERMARLEQEKVPLIMELLEM